MLSLNQIRFLGEMSVFAALFATLGFLFLADRVDIIPVSNLFDSSVTTIEDTVSVRSVVVPLFVLFLLISGAGLVQTPVKQSQLTIDDDRYETITWIERYSERNPRPPGGDYVFSGWGRNRVDNYFVNGQSRSYQYAQDNYLPFISSTDPRTWYGRLSSNGVEFIITRDLDAEFPDHSMHTRLHEHWGTASIDMRGLGHYRAIYASSGVDTRSTLSSKV
ncbi:hypothetical protein VB773_02445 [Haloarculaceae archaeon H-GB2-1]|nr:hypothetical protein [Haloarculaceae archaeon H-GB2-1]